MLPEPDRIRLQHMLDATREARGYIQDRSRSDLDRETMLLRALVNCLEVIGEAATHVSEQTRSQMTKIPWRAIIGMRNRLIHAYFDINKDIVWKTVTSELAHLEPLLSTVLETNASGIHATN
jgi:uncharacterized protein with HEPN domain